VPVRNNLVVRSMHDQHWHANLGPVLVSQVKIHVAQSNVSLQAPGRASTLCGVGGGGAVREKLMYPHNGILGTWCSREVPKPR
jgi:hypothetical protein